MDLESAWQLKGQLESMDMEDLGVTPFEKGVAVVSPRRVGSSTAAFPGRRDSSGSIMM